ncbi:MAG: tRNA adenosine(34) deaminase TadA [Clostridia bacterium]|nr:tRNA adenosine(34) deaminase TadA [Clostridia bacterium]
MNERDERFMRRALALADEAAALGEVPVGAVVVMGDEIISEAYNRRELDKNATAHAELIAIDAACKKLGGWRLHKCELYVTLEPCPMCAGAIVNSRIKRVVIAAKDAKAGALGSLINLNFYPLNHHPETVFGVCEKEAALQLQSFFKRLRERKNSRPR